ncbi:MAG: hypothetical protein ACRCTY_10570 [Candidatus Adiutrix sp.]
MKIESIAAIDVGSNAIRLLISNAEDYEEAKALKKNAYIRVPVRLGEDVFNHGEIGPEKLRLFTETMQAFVHLMRVFAIKKYCACATSAMREAKNSPKVIEHILAQTGLKINVISGGQEAELVFEAGGLAQTMAPDKCFLHVDVGGGSTEVVVYSEQKKLKSLSFPIGSLRILAGAVSEEMKQDFKEQISAIQKQYKPETIVASGGNINKTLKLLGEKDGAKLKRSTLNDFYQKLSSLSVTERLKQYKMNSYRADVIVPALYIFLTIGDICQVKDFTIPKVGLVDGIIRQLYAGKLAADFLEI